jgi:rhodanese-related sulfurtransferase
MANAGRALADAARHAMPRVSNEDLQAQLKTGTPPVILDVREPDETADGHIPQAVLPPRGRLEGRVEHIVPDKTTPVVTHCAGEGRGAMAAQRLRQMGYAHVSYLAGGFNAWKAKELPIERPTPER